MLTGGNIRVCHYNIQGNDFDESDFEQYNTENSIRHWLIPEKYKYEKGDVKKYGGYSGGSNPTVFWGEFHEEKWNFYYQTPDGEIHEFQYNKDKEE